MLAVSLRAMIMGSRESEDSRLAQSVAPIITDQCGMVKATNIFWYHIHSVNKTCHQCAYLEYENLTSTSVEHAKNSSRILQARLQWPRIGDRLDGANRTGLTDHASSTVSSSPSRLQACMNGYAGAKNNDGVVSCSLAVSRLHYKVAHTCIRTKQPSGVDIGHDTCSILGISIVLSISWESWVA